MSDLPEYRLSYLLHHIQIVILTHSDLIYQRLNQQFQSHAATLESERVEYTFYIEELDSVVESIIPEPVSAIKTKIELCDAPVTYAEECFFSHQEGRYAHQMRFNLLNRCLYLNVGPRYLEMDCSLFYGFIRVFLNALIYPFHQLKGFHGAALHQGDKVVFLTGESGAGKTTTALELLRSGYSILSDDSPLLTIRQGRTAVLSSLDHIRIWPHTLTLFPECQDWVWPKTSANGKLVLNRFWMNPNSLCLGPVPLTHYITIDRGNHSFPSIHRLDKETLLHEQLQKTINVFTETAILNELQPCREYTEFMLEMTFQLVRDAAVYRIQFNDQHLERVPELIASI